MTFKHEEHLRQCFVSIPVAPRLHSYCGLSVCYRRFVCSHSFLIAIQRQDQRKFRFNYWFYLIYGNFLYYLMRTFARDYNFSYADHPLDIVLYITIKSSFFNLNFFPLPSYSTEKKKELVKDVETLAKVVPLSSLVAQNGSLTIDRANLMLKVSFQTTPNDVLKVTFAATLSSISGCSTG